MEVSNLCLPRLMRIGGGVSHQLPTVLKQLGLVHPLIVTDHFLLGSGRVDALVDGLSEGGIASRIFADTVPEPTIGSIEAGIAFARQAHHDSVIGFGGGSPIDSAKAVAVMGPHGGSVADYKMPHLQETPGLPVIAIPTTAGTGSEVTRFTIITDEISDEKMLCAGMAYMPTAALVDYELTLSKPPRLTADTGIDALTHAIEAYVSRRANPFSDEMALAAIRAIAPNLRRVYRDGSDRAAREAVMYGATLAGMAFSNASVALVHGMSRPIGAHFHVPHGLSNAMLLPIVTAFSASAARTRYAACADAMGVVVPGEGEQGAVGRLLDELVSLNRDLDVPSPRDYGIEPARWEGLLATMAAQARASGSPANNPREPSIAEMIDLYRQAWAPAAG